MATIVTRLANTGTLLLNGSFDEVTFNKAAPTIKNLSVYTQNFATANWSNFQQNANSVVLTDNVTIAPDGTQTGAKFASNNATSGYYSFLRGANIAANVDYVWSTYVKAAERSAMNLTLYTTGYNNIISINLTDGSTVVSATDPGLTMTGGATGVGNGWYRLYCTFRRTTAEPNGQYKYGLDVGNLAVGQGVYVWGDQVEYGTTPTIYQGVVGPGVLVTPTFVVKTAIDSIYPTGGFDEVTGMVAAANLVAYFDAGKVESYPSTGTTWVDISGNTNNGTIVNAPTYTSTSPGTFSFNGTSQYVNFPRPVQDDFTLACWFQTTSAFGTAGAWWQGMGLIDGEMPGGQNDFGLSVGAGKTMLGIGNPDQTLLSSSTYNDGVWHYVAGTRNKTSGVVKMYVDGALVNSATFSGTNTLSSPANLTIGALQTLASYYSGNIASVQLYSRELTLAEVQNNFNVDAARFSRTPLAKPGVKREANTGILTAATFDEITGAPVIDSSLLLWLDAGQPTSYSGTGSTWTDLSTYQNNATLSGTSFSTAYGGSLNFVPAQGSLGALTSSKLNTTYTGKTILMAARMDAAFGLSSGFHGMFGTADGVALRNFNTYMFSDATGYKIHFSWGNGAVNDGNTSDYLPVTPGQWFVIAVSQNATGHTYYYNGMAYGSRVGAFTQYNTTTNETVGKADNIFIGDIATVMLYTRALTADEINQNFNALRRRFGI